MVDILDFEYSSRGRDIDIVEPTLSYMEQQGFTVVRRYLWDTPMIDILRFRPKVIVLANGIGSLEHFKVTKCASLLGIKVVNFVSEGDYVNDKNRLMQFFWGWNHDRVNYADLRLEWSFKNINLIKNTLGYNNLDYIKVIGATGFDKYKICSFIDKNTFLRQNSYRFQKVVGIAGWSFDHFSGDYYAKFKDSIDKIYSNKNVSDLLRAKDLLIIEYHKLVCNNPDVLFIFKFHPLIIDESLSEFHTLDCYDNVCFYKTEMNIYDIINICDLWISFESTTSLEAWLLNKPTAYLNPELVEFPRSSISTGSPIFSNADELQTMIDALYCGDVMIDFKAKESIRRDLIIDTIGFEDGLSFIRAAKEITSLYHKKNNKKIKITSDVFYLLQYSLKNMLKKMILKLNLPLFKERQNYWERHFLLFSYKERKEKVTFYTKLISKYEGEFVGNN